MSSRRLVVVGGGLVVAVAAVVAIVLARSGDDRASAPVGDALAEALSFAPTSAPAVVQFDVQASSPQGERLRELARTFPAARFAADGIRGSVRSLGLDADRDLPDLLGGPLVAWGPPEAIASLATSFTSLRLELGPVLKAGVSAAVVGRSADAVRATLDRAVDERRLRKAGDQYMLPSGAGRIGVRGADVVLAKDAAAVRQALSTAAAGAGLTRRTFEARLGPLARTPALIRATAPARPLLAPRASGIAWVDALRQGSAAISLEKPGVRLRVHLATDATKLEDGDLPLAAGPQPPRPAPGPRPIDVAVREPAQLVRWLTPNREQLDLPFIAPLVRALGTLDSVKGPLQTFGRIDVDDILAGLTGTATVTSEAGSALALRAETTKADELRTALNRLAAVPDVALDLAGVKLNVERDGDAYIITDGDRQVAKLAVLGDVLVVADGARVGLRAIADRRPTSVRTAGALTLHLGGQAVQDEVVRRFGLPDLARLVLGGFGDIDGGLRVERGGADLDATLALN